MSRSTANIVATATSTATPTDNATLTAPANATATNTTTAIATLSLSPAPALCQTPAPARGHVVWWAILVEAGCVVVDKPDVGRRCSQRAALCTQWCKPIPPCLT
jgi:hypothetical protein